MRGSFLGTCLLFSVLGMYAWLDDQSDYDLFFPSPSDNFVIRWAFQAQCDFVFDPRTIWPTPAKRRGPVSFDPDKVQPGNMIFVRDAPHFFKTMHKHIKVPYFIMTHGEYLDMFQKWFHKYLDNNPQILGWFTIHPCKKFHERVFPLPLGIIQYNDLYDKRVAVHKQYLKYRKSKKEKLLYMNFTDWRNPARKRIRNFFLEKSYCHNGGKCRFNQYIRETAEHKFSISPPGLGPDLYRIYESLLVGTIPIVQHSYLDWFYEGLPVLFIDRWEEVTEEFLQQKYAEITSKKYDPEKLYMDYWIEYIQRTRDCLFVQYQQGN